VLLGCPSGRFTLPGVVNKPRLAMSAMSVYLTINLGEVTGIAALEASLCGVPLIALQVDFANEPTGEEWIWSSGSSEAVIIRIKEMLANPEEGKRIAARQLERTIQAHSVDTMLRSYLELYSRAMAGRRKPETCV